MTEDKNLPEELQPTAQTDTGQGGEAKANEDESGIDRLRQKIEELQKLADTHKDQFLRKAAEFDNYKRRTESEYINIVRNANESLLISLIPIIEDLVRSLKSGKDQKDPEGFYRGVELILQKLMKGLEARGLVPFESVGKPFDVEYHDALLQVPRSDVPPHTVIEEVERGYKLNEKILRHAKVIVSSPEDTPPEQENVPADGNTEGAETRA